MLMQKKRFGILPPRGTKGGAPHSILHTRHMTLMIRE